MGVNFLYELLHTSSVLPIIGTKGILGRRWRLGEGYLLGVPQERIIRHSYSLKGSHPTFLKLEPPHLMDNWFCRILGIREASVISFVFASFKGRLQIFYFVNLCQVEALCFCQLELRPAHLHFQLCQPPLC